MAEMIQITEPAKQDYRLTTSTGVRRWSNYLLVYRKHMIKHGRKAEIRREDNMISLWVDKIA
jgi:hypothetical protein